RFGQRAIPIQVNVDADVGAIKEAVRAVAKGIPVGGSFKIEVTKRGSDLSSSEIIKESASMVQRRVNLEKPAYTVRVEIVDERAGIALLTDQDLLSVTRLQEKAMKESG
ncbi:MAG TPA: THUMP domain-containing protein, partial [Candidatus Methanomethylicus sp.]|nr:THUMP domain-containing protein [Candidatus Methanomethylicus sp.]